MEELVELPKLADSGGFVVNNASYVIDPEGDDGLVRVGSVAQLISVLTCVMGRSEREIWFRGQRLRSRRLEPTYFRNTKRRDAGNLTAAYDADAISQPQHDLGDLHALLAVVRTVFLRHGFQDLTDMKVLLLAQHYGVTTPLVDWSTSPLVAAWFALEKFPKLDSEDPPTLWLLDPQFVNTGVPYAIPARLSNSPGLDIVDVAEVLLRSADTLRNNETSQDFPLALYSGSDFSARIGRQSGKFTFSGPNLLFRNVVTGSATLGENGERPFAPILLDPGRAEDMLRELRLLGINELTVYGPRDLDKAIADELAREGLSTDGRRSSWLRVPSADLA
ncbi:hypothetical protein GCM10009712_37220 [Pseudarthrobacter sulfonivorans]|uniref:FRG domain-containing protein n=1 Tax=Pseudarthrobacter sulfonivorans TaxID=121292 RepID=UPI00168BB97B|nr:FRG domain-containing protein [Pseudarthrobacter sulfonivorans]